VVDRQGLRKARRHHAQDVWNHDDRLAARGLGAIPGGAQVSPLAPAGVRRYTAHPFWQAVAIMVAAYVVVEWIIPILPGSAIVPKSVVLQYMVTVLVGVLIYVSDNEQRWTTFKDPINAVLVEPRLRVAKGGPGLPREGTPWNSAMPKWEDFLTEREIWSVILFLYDQTGWTPRTWEKTGTGDAGRGTGHD